MGEFLLIEDYLWFMYEHDKNPSAVGCIFTQGVHWFRFAEAATFLVRIHQTCVGKVTFHTDDSCPGIPQFATVLTQFSYHAGMGPVMLRYYPMNFACSQKIPSSATSSWDRSFLGDALPHESRHPQTPAGLDGRWPAEHPAEEGTILPR